jgi:hypothetical protein
MRRIDVIQTLALSSVLILALGGSGCAGGEDTDTGEPPSVEVSPPAEATEEAVDETSPPAEEAVDETSPPAEEAVDETSPPAEEADTEASEEEEE